MNVSQIAFSFRAFCLALCLLTTSCATRLSSDFVEVKEVIPNIALDVRYATTNNFTGKQLYESDRVLLRRSTAEKLRAAQRDFNALGFGLKIYDAYRPLSVQKKMWEVFPKEGYVANPAKGSRHNRGAAVDVTLINLADGTEFEMPSEYDDFSKKAHRNFKSSDRATRNRELLESIMEKHGFVGLPTEWWHFDDANWEFYPLSDIDSSQIK